MALASLCLAMPVRAQEDVTPAQVSLGPGVPAKPLKRVTPRLPDELVQKGYEGWVVVSFVVKADGSVGDIIVEDSTSPVLDDLTVRAVSKWTYEPATAQGVPVDQSSTGVFVLFGHDPPRPRSRAFVNAYNEITAQIREGKLDAAQRRVSELQSVDLALRERVYVSWLDAVLRQQRGEAARELRSLQRATINQGKFLDEASHASALASMFRLRIEGNELHRALETFKALSKIQTPSEALAGVAQRARDIIAGDTAIGRSGSIPTQSEIEANEARRVWSHVLVRREIAFNDVVGKLETIDFRCNRYRATDSITDEKAWKIPPSWGNCAVYVYGTPGTTFTLVEYPEEKATKSALPQE